jgi:SAM-dependent methyltransferase
MIDLKRLRRGDLRIEDRGPTAFLWSSLAHYGLRALLLKPAKRDKQFVTDEYNHDHRDEYWKPTMSFDDFVYGNATDLVWTLIDHEPCRTTLADVRRRLLPRLAGRIAQYTKRGDLVVEFGAGTGRNLAYLARELPDRTYVGLELTPRSVEDARAQMRALDLPVDMRVADVTLPTGLVAAVSYSVLALEQMPNSISREAIHQMAATASRAIICFEPIRELYPLSVRGLTSRLRQYRADYLSNLPKHVRDLNLSVIKLERSGLGNSALNEICELVIET